MNPSAPQEVGGENWMLPCANVLAYFSGQCWRLTARGALFINPCLRTQVTSWSSEKHRLLYVDKPSRIAFQLIAQFKSIFTGKWQMLKWQSFNALWFWIVQCTHASPLENLEIYPLKSWFHDRKVIITVMHTSTVIWWGKASCWV